MALSRAEIELLIKAKNDAQAAFDQLHKQVDGVTKGAGDASKSMEGLDKATKNTGSSGVATGVILGNLATQLVQGLVGGFKASIDAASRLDSGLIGLGATAKAFKVDSDEAQRAAQQLASDGLMTVGEAAGGLKNLLAAGFGLPESVTLMNRFKDSAAFGRQGALGFGEAIMGATEGLKNGNSALVDNAGVTKNLSVILSEAGLSANDLQRASSDVNVRMALFNGILKETNPQLGNTALYLDTAAGKQAGFNSQVEIAQQKIGKALQPALAAALDVLQPFVKVVGDAAPVLVPATAAMAAFVTPMLLINSATALGIPRLFSFASGITATGVAAAEATPSVLSLNAALGLVGAVAVLGVTAWHERNKALAEYAKMGNTVAEKTALITEKEQQLQAAMKFGNPAAEQAIRNELTALRAGLERAKALEAEAKAQTVATEKVKERVTLDDSLARSQKQVQTELAGTGYTVAQLTAALDKDADGFKSWAKENKLSGEAVNYLEDRLKAQAEAQKKATDETKRASETQQKLRDGLESIGIVTERQVNTHLKEFADLQHQAMQEGISWEKVVASIYPGLMHLAEEAEASGIQVAGLALAVKNATFVMQSTIPPAFGVVEDATAVLKDFDSVQISVFDETAYRTDQAGRAMKAFGITSQEELRHAAVEARKNYDAIALAFGKAAPEAVAAYKKMTDAQIAATGEVPTFWKTNVFPSIRNTVGQIGSAVEGSFSQILLGAKSFGEAFKDIWSSIKAGVLKIMAEMLSGFVNGFLHGVLAAMGGQQGAMSAAFAGMLGGGGGLSGLVGHAGSQGSGFIGPVLPGQGIGGFLTSAAGGSLLGGGAGLGAGFLVGDRYGTGKGILAGIGAGAAVGSIGGPIGMGVGALAGLIGGAIGGAKNNTLAQRQKFAKDLGYDSLDALFADLAAKSPDDAGSLQNTALNKIGKKDTAANKTWMEAVVAALDKAGKKADEVKGKMAALAAATERYGLTWEDMDQTVQQTKIGEIATQLLKDQTALEAAGYRHESVLKKQADAYSELISKSSELNLDLPAALKPTLESLLEMGLLVDAAGDKLKDLSGTHFAPVVVPVIVDTSGVPGGGQATTGGRGPGAAWDGQDVEGGAAGGVMANRPGLVLFGEGGEPEVGGPASFFAKVFKQVGVGGGTVHNWNINGVLDSRDVRRTIEDKILPHLAPAVKANRSSSRTDLRQALGMT